MNDAYRETPFMTLEQYYIDGRIIYAEIPINWKIVLGV
jgi:hypothetical protein